MRIGIIELLLLLGLVGGAIVGAWVFFSRGPNEKKDE